jgi:hypothetical protein
MLPRVLCFHHGECNRERDVTEFSPAGASETRLWCSAVPHGTVLLAYHYPGLRPGLLSARPCGTKCRVLTQGLKP